MFTPHRMLLPLGALALAALVACGRPVTPSDVRMAGVGLNPDEIGPTPELAGGYIEYDWVNFAGGGLSLASLGLVSYAEVGPELSGFKPPYAAVYGLGFIFDELVPGPDAQFGNFGLPPDVEDACWTNLEPASALSAGLTEVGSEITIASADGSTAYTLGRYPEIYPPDPQDIFVYYIGVEAWHATPQQSWTTDDAGQLTRQVLTPVNFTHGAEVKVAFPGGLPPLEAPVASIPLPSATVENEPFFLPTRADNLHVQWSGPTWGEAGAQGESGAWSSCVAFAGEPMSQSEYDALTPDQQAALCQGHPEAPSDSLSYPGQLYTGPWDADNGQVTFRWNPNPDGTHETVSLSVRFLGPIDPTAESFLEARVPLESYDGLEDDWANAQDRGFVPEGEPVPQGYRAPLACDDDVEWVFDSSLASEGTSLQGDPSWNLAEVSCRLADDGEFALTMDHLQSAVAYAQRKGAAGVVFSFTRSTELHATVPPVKDSVGMKVETSPVIVRSNSTEIGRFWLDGGLDAVQE